MLAGALAGAPVLPEPPSAAPDPVDLRWDAPEGCPDAEMVRTAVTMYSSDAAVDRAVRAEATVVAEAEGYALTLVLHDDARSETRSLRSRDCDALARAAGLVIAVARDPLGVARRIADRETAAKEARPEVPEPVPELAPEIIPRPETPRSRDDRSVRAREDGAPRARDETKRPPPPLRLGLRPEILLGGGLLPGPVGAAVGGQLALFGRARPWRVELGGAYWFPRTANVGDTPAGGRLWLAYARASGCGVPVVRGIELPLCAGPDLGAVGGEGFGPGVTTRRNADTWVGAHGSVGVAWAPIPALALVARVEGVVSLRRPGFRLDGVGAVHRAGAGGARGAIGLEVRFF